MSKQSFDKFFGDVTKTLKDGFEKVTTKGEQYGRMGRLKVDMFSLEKEMSRSKTQLGDRVYALALENPEAAVLTDDSVKGHIEKLNDLKERLALKKEQYEHVEHTEAEAASNNAETADNPAPQSSRASSTDEKTESEARETVQAETADKQTAAA